MCQQATKSKPILELRDVSIQISDKVITKNINLSCAKGTLTALVGESGSGKSVTGLSILKLLPKTTSYSGSILFENKELLTLPESEMRKLRGKSIATIFQEPRNSMDPLQNVEERIGETLALHNPLLSKTQMLEKIITLLTEVGLTEPKQMLKRYPHQMSGGQCQRIAIADALAGEPSLLIADEPTTALDVTVQKQILELLISLTKARGMGLLFITHDLNIVQLYAETVYVMHQGSIIEHADTKTIFSNPQEAYTKELLKERTTPLNTTPFNGDILMEAKNVNVIYDSPQSFLRQAPMHAVKDVSFALHAKESIGIIGESGSGKSSLALALLGLLPFEGEVFFDSHALSSYTNKQIRPLRKYMQIVFQDPFSSLNPRLTIDKIIAEGLLLYEKMNAKELEDRVCGALIDVGLSPKARFQYPHEFSGGEKQRIAIARSLIVRPKLLVLDEPSSSLDRTIQFQILDLLATMRDKYSLSYLFITHDLRLAKNFCHSVLIMQNGNLVESGEMNYLMQHSKSPYTHELFQAGGII